MPMLNYMTVPEVSSELGIPEWLIRRAIQGRIANAPRLPAVRLGRRRLIRLVFLRFWLLEAQGAIDLPAGTIQKVTRECKLLAKEDDIQSEADRKIARLRSKSATVTPAR